MIGWVYIATNKALPGLVKVGFSTKDPKFRMQELSQAGLPYDHQCVFWVMCKNPRDIEQRVHRHLHDKRESKEWFRCEPEHAAAAILHFVPKPIGKYDRDLPTKILEELREQERLARVAAYEAEQQAQRIAAAQAEAERCKVIAQHERARAQCEEVRRGERALWIVGGLGTLLLMWQVILKAIGA